MKLKFFLRGFGAGIVLTALILCISYRVVKPEQNVVEQAKELGMVFPEGTQVPVAETEQPQLTVTPTPERETAKPTKTAKPAKSTIKPSNQTEKTKGTRFTVRGGLISSSVAKEMKEAGIIKSDEELDAYLEESGYSREIRAGTYFIPAGASYEEIARIITGRE